MLGVSHGKKGSKHPEVVGYETHSYHKQHEKYFIIGTLDRNNPLAGAVHSIEYSRLNHGLGLRLPTHAPMIIGNYFYSPPKIY